MGEECSDRETACAKALCRLVMSKVRGAGNGVDAGPERDGKLQSVPEHTEARVEARRPGRGSSGDSAQGGGYEVEQGARVL